MNDKIRNYIKEQIDSLFDEERIPNSKASEYVKDKENFVGSHTYGEDLGDLGKMYVAYSYGEQHPLYIWVDKEEFKKLRPYEVRLSSGVDESKGLHFINDTILEDKKESDEKENSQKKSKQGAWFYNESPYLTSDAKGKIKPNKWTYKHLKNLKPNERTQARNTNYLKRLISDFKKKHGIGDNKHADLTPGEK